MSHPRVIHVRDWREGDHYIGRSMPSWCGSKFANPFTLKQYGKRCLVMFLDMLAADPGLQAAARVELGDAGRLVCWCAPGLCHGDVLARFLAGEELAAIRFDLLVLIGETRDLFG